MPISDNTVMDRTVLNNQTNFQSADRAFLCFISIADAVRSNLSAGCLLDKEIEL